MVTRFENPGILAQNLFLGIAGDGLERRIRGDDVSINIGYRDPLRSVLEGPFRQAQLLLGNTVCLSQLFVLKHPFYRFTQSGRPVFQDIVVGALPEGIDGRLFTNAAGNDNEG